MLRQSDAILGARPAGLTAGYAWGLASPRLRRVISGLALAILGLVTLSLATRVVYPRMEAVEHLAGGHTGPVNNPWKFDEVTEGNRIEVTLPLRWGTPTRWNIRPDDLLTLLRVNDRTVPLSEAQPRAGIHDWERGFVIDLSRWLERGDNRVEMTVTNKGGPGGVTMRPILGWRALLVAAAFAPWLFVLSGIFRLSRIEIAVLGAAVAVCCWYWGATLWFERAYDTKFYGGGGHLDYVIYIAEHLRLPAPNEGWQYYQPPLYYVLGAFAWRWGEWVGTSGPEALRALSLCLWLVFVISSVAAMKLALRPSPWVRAAVTAALALWPSAVLAAPRIGNDLALYAASGLATYFMVRWWRGQKVEHLVGMAASIAASFTCKGTGVALLAAAALLVAARLSTRRRWRKKDSWVTAVAAGAIMASGATLGLARNLWYWKQGKLSGWFVSNIPTLDANLRVPNGFRAFVPFDVPVFLSEPWLDSRNDATGRANFWNYFLRSSLSGEFRFDGALHTWIALAWGALVLALVLGLVRRPFGRRPPVVSLWRDAPWYALGFFWVASSVSARATYPFSCGSDFRYVLPVLVPFLVACGRGRSVSLALLALVSVSSAVFYVSL
jgi:hypothetical protein